MRENYTKHILDNGLTILLKEMHTAPLISHWVWYRVGSRNEQVGKTGVSHWVEHMQFKGTAKYASNVLDREISRHGGHWNAFTYMDWTAFFETMPSDSIDIAIDLEADRMVNSLYLPGEVESERTVILSELEGNENDPYFRLSKAVHQAAFCSHPYGREVIGEREDLLALTRDELYAHYHNHYAPNNAVLVMAGDFDSDEMLRKLETVYRGIPARKVPEYNILPEGTMGASQMLEVHGPCEVTTMEKVWRAPAGNDRDIYALSILDSILCGPSSLNMFGKGGIPNRTSRLYRRLVATGMAAAMGGHYTTTIDPYLYSFYAYINPGCTPAEISEAVNDELADIAKNGVRPEELEKARKQSKAMFAYSCENITNQAYWLGYTSMFANPNWYLDYVSNLENVKIEDVCRVTSKYLDPAHCVTGIYSSNEEEAEA